MSVALNNLESNLMNNLTNTQVPETPTAGSLNDILSKAAGGNTFNKATDSLEAIRDKIDTLPTSITESAEYTASGAITAGDLVGVTSDGKATKLTADWAPQTVPSTFTTIATGSANTTQSHSCWVDTGNGSKIITVYNNNKNIYVVVSTIDANGTPTPGVPVDTTYNTGSDTNPVRVVKLDTDKAQIFYIDSDHSNYGYSAVITISGTVPTVAASVAFSGTTVPLSIDATSLSTDKCCVSYKGTGIASYYINGCTISGTTQTWGTRAQSGNTSSTNTGQSSICRVNTDLVAWFYESDAAGIYAANVSFSGVNPTRNGTDQPVILASGAAATDLSLSCCSPSTGIAVVVTQNPAKAGVCTITGTNNPVIGVTNGIEINTEGTQFQISCNSMDSTHVVVAGYANSLIITVIEVNTPATIRVLSGTGISGTIKRGSLLFTTAGKAIEIGEDTNNVIIQRPFKVYYKGITTYSDATVPVPVYGFLGVALDNISDASTGTIGLKGTFTGYASGLNPLKKYVRGINEYQAIKTVNKDYPYGEVLANVMSATGIEIMIPPGSSVSTDNYKAFEYVPSLSGNGPWLNITVAAVDTWTAWTSYLVPGNTDRFIDGLSYMCQPMNTGDEYIDAVQIGYGSTTLNVTLLASVPLGYESLTAVGLYPAIVMPLSKLRVPAGQTIYMRHCRYDGDITTENVKLALTLSQLQ